MAHAKLTGALVESEPHYFGGSSNAQRKIDYEEIKKKRGHATGHENLLRQQELDTFAAAIGNLYGEYPVPKVRPPAFSRTAQPPLAILVCTAARPVTTLETPLPLA